MFGYFDPAWQKRWMVLKRGFVAYMDHDRQEIRGVLLFDSSFQVHRGRSNLIQFKFNFWVSSGIKGKDINPLKFSIIFVTTRSYNLVTSTF